MKITKENPSTKEIFETKPVPAALAKMAIPTIISQLITLVYNIADTWFIGQTNNPYMVAASSLVLTIFFTNDSDCQFVWCRWRKSGRSFVGKQG